MSTDHPLTRHALSGPTMGTRWSAQIWLAHGQKPTPVSEALADAVARVDQQMSNWQSASDLMRFNAAPVREWVDLPKELMTVLATAQEIGRASDGLFEIGVGGLVRAWGFGPAQGQTDPAAIRAAMGNTIRTETALELDIAQGRARKTAPMTLDLSGIAKGYGVDLMAEVCAVQSDHWLVAIDGELRASSGKPDGSAFAVAVEKPLIDLRSPLGVVELVGRAIATSGDYRHFVQVGDVRLSHSMNPRLGGPVQNALGSVSVLAPTCMQADAWATVLMVLGEVAGPAFATAHGIEAIFVVREGDGFRQVFTAA